MATSSKKRISRLKATAKKGHFAVYTIDGRRFVTPLAYPLAYLKTEVLKGLLTIAEEEFGVSSDCAITLLCD